MESTERRYRKEEFAFRGDSIYENNIRPQLKPEDEGKFVAIDIDTGVYEVDAGELEAGDKLRWRGSPNAQIWIVRVGSRSVHRFGGRAGATRHDCRRGQFRRSTYSFDRSGTSGREQEVHAIIDTGYTASLTLPPALVATLGLRLAKRGPWNAGRRQRMPI